MSLLDLVIVGGGPAGLSTALHVLAAAPHTKLVVLEKERYPRDKICAGGIGARAFRLLEKIDVEVSCPRVSLDALALRVGDRTIVVRQPGLGVVVRRFLFDHAFAKVARARGVDVRDGCAVVALAVTDDGVRIETTGEPLHARAVVGADGIGGIVRRQIGMPRGELRAQVVELDTEAAPIDQPRDTIVFDFATRDLHGYAWDFPTLVDDRPLVCRGVYCIHDGTRPLDEPHTRTAAYLAARGLDITRYKLKRFAERGLEPGTQLSRPRVLLTGEAAGIDIATGEGIGQAIEYGALAGPYLADALARNELGFADWRATLERRHLGKQFRIRHACYRAFYGPRRDTIERAMPRIESLIKVGLQDFAGVPLSKLALARGAGQFLISLTGQMLTGGK